MRHALHFNITHAKKGIIMKSTRGDKMIGFDVSNIVEDRSTEREKNKMILNVDQVNDVW
jgi:hypothetical protein